MADLVVIVPSRGRPEAAVALARFFADTCTADTRLAFAIDEDDPKRGCYTDALDGYGATVVHYGPAPTTMVRALNAVASLYANDEDVVPHEAFAIGFMGDDHCPRTHGWDAAYLDALRDLGTGIVYGNDLLQGSRLPTQCAMTSDIVRALGYMSPPSLRHLYVDNFWRDLGKAAGCLRYLPQVTIEHRHPLAGKATWDEGYLRVNAPEVADHDRQAYEAYVADGLYADVTKVLVASAVSRALRGAA